MSKKIAPYDLYLAIRPRAKESRKAFDTLKGILEVYPGANGSLAGIGHDSHHVIFCMRFSVPVSNSDPGAIASIKCINALFETMFDYMPHYCVEPTMAEAQAAMSFLDSNDNALDLSPDTTPLLNVRV